MAVVTMSRVTCVCYYRTVPIVTKSTPNTDAATIITWCFTMPMIGSSQLSAELAPSVSVVFVPGHVLQLAAAGLA